jgi:D-aminopeptidase
VRLIWVRKNLKNTFEEGFEEVFVYQIHDYQKNIAGEINPTSVEAIRVFFKSLFLLLGLMF